MQIEADRYMYVDRLFEMLVGFVRAPSSKTECFFCSCFDDCICLLLFFARLQLSLDGISGHSKLGWEAFVICCVFGCFSIIP